MLRTKLVTLYLPLCQLTILSSGAFWPIRHSVAGLTEGLKSVRRVCSLFFFLVLRPCLVPFSFRLNSLIIPAKTSREKQTASSLCWSPSGWARPETNKNICHWVWLQKRDIISRGTQEHWNNTFSGSWTVQISKFLIPSHILTNTTALLTAM